MDRDGKIALAHQRRAEGLKLREIAEELSVPLSTVGQWFQDPDGEKARARKRRYGRPCEGCGARTTGSNGAAKAPRFCKDCAPAINAIWTQEAIVAAMHRFHERYGRKPCATDFNGALANQIGHLWRRERFYADGDYPCTRTVVYVFGSWNAAIEAAGFDSWDAGYYPGLARPRGLHLTTERH